MKARNIFGLVVRIVGLCVVLYALWYLAFGIAFAIRVLHDPERESYTIAYFTSGIPGLVVGLGLLRFARQIVRFSYPCEKEDSDG